MQSSSHQRRTLLLHVFLVALAPLAACQNLMAPAPNLYTDSDINPFENVIPEYQTNTVEVIYATDRLPQNQPGERIRYRWQRSMSLAFGVATVELGREVSWEQLVQASRNARRETPINIRVVDVEERWRLSETPIDYMYDDGVITEDPDELAHDREVARKFQELVAERLAKTDTKDVYIFIHGFNNTFERSAGVIAEVWHYLGREGVPIVYSWPSGAPGLIRGYVRDRESGEFTIFHLKQFAKILEGTPGLERIHVIAHSRGADIVLTAVRELAIENRGAGGPLQRPRFETLILAAADIDIEVTGQRVTAERVTRFAHSLVLYIREDDRALNASKWLTRSDARLGTLRWEQISEANQKRMKRQGGNGEIIDARISTGFIGHSYFYDHPAVLSDLILLLKYYRDPGADNGRPLNRKNPVMWELTSDYPYGKVDANGVFINPSAAEED